MEVRRALVTQSVRSRRLLGAERAVGTFLLRQCSFPVDPRGDWGPMAVERACVRLRTHRTPHQSKCTGTLGSENNRLQIERVFVFTPSFKIRLSCLFYDFSCLGKCAKLSFKSLFVKMQGNLLGLVCCVNYSSPVQ